MLYPVRILSWGQRSVQVHIIVTYERSGFVTGLLHQVRVVPKRDYHEDDACDKVPML